MDTSAKSVNTYSYPDKKEDLAMKDEKVTYLRLLGMTENGRAYLNRYKKEFPFPIIVKRASFDHPSIRIDSKAARIHAMGLPEKYQQKAIELEFTQQPIYLGKKYKAALTKQSDCVFIFSPLSLFK